MSDPLRVAIDARPLSHPQAGGFRSYVRALLTGLRESDADLSLILYIDRPLTPDAEAALPAGAETRIVGTSRLRADWLALPRRLHADAPDLFWGTSNYLPVRVPRGIVPVVTIHDAMGVAAYPWDRGVRRNARERFINRYWSWQTRGSARTARRVLTVSHGAAREIERTMGVTAERLRVVYNGISPATPSASESTGGEREADSVLVIESPDPRKNVAVVYPAMAALTTRLGRSARLRVVANGDRAVERVRRAGMANAEILTGLSDAGLADAYARSPVFAWPSRWEGFGLPPLEAMTRGCAVVSSTAPVMPEILGDVPRYADPDSPDAFAEQIAALLTDDAERAERGQLGKALAATYTCRRMAEETVAVLREAVVA